MEDSIDVYILGRKIGTAAGYMQEDFLRVGYYDFETINPDYRSGKYISIDYMSGEITYYKKETIH